MTSFAQSKPIIVRNARPEDASQVAELGSLVFSLTFGHSVEPYQLQAYLDEAYTVSAIAADISGPSKNMVTAVDGEKGTIIGFALLARGTSDPCIEHLQNTVELQRLYVHPDFHGKGVGTLMAKKMDDIAKQQGFKHIWLGVWEENQKATKVYEKLGYARVGEHAFAIGDISQTDHIMLKQL